MDNEKGRSTDYNELQVALSPEDGKIISVACGWSHTLVLCESKEGHSSIYCFGSNAFSQIGLSSPQTSIAQPLSFPNNIKVRAISCGMRHSAFTTVDGELWLLGENRFGQCGAATLEAVKVPTRLSTELFITSVSLGARHTIFLTKDGRLYSFGENRFGQCGVDPATVPPIQRPNTSKTVKDIILEPREVEILEPMDDTTQIRCGWNFSLVWTPSSASRDIATLYMFGRNNYGQIGIGKITPFEWKPLRPLNSEKTKSIESDIVQVECGSEHTLILCNDSRLYSFGWNDHGQLGHGDESDRAKPTLVSALQGETLGRIAVGYGFSFAMN